MKNYIKYFVLFLFLLSSYAVHGQNEPVMKRLNKEELTKMMSPQVEGAPDPFPLLVQQLQNYKDSKYIILSIFEESAQKIPEFKMESNGAVILEDYDESRIHFRRVYYTGRLMDELSGSFEQSEIEATARKMLLNNQFYTTKPRWIELVSKNGGKEPVELLDEYLKQEIGGLPKDLYVKSVPGHEPDEKYTEPMFKPISAKIDLCIQGIGALKQMNTPESWDVAISRSKDLLGVLKRIHYEGETAYDVTMRRSDLMNNYAFKIPDDVIEKAMKDSRPSELQNRSGNKKEDLKVENQISETVGKKSRIDFLLLGGGLILILAITVGTWAYLRTK